MFAYHNNKTINYCAFACIENNLHVLFSENGCVRIGKSFGHFRYVSERHRERNTKNTVNCVGSYVVSTCVYLRNNMVQV